MASGTSQDAIFAAMAQAVEQDETLAKRFQACVLFNVEDGSTCCLDTKMGTFTITVNEQDAPPGDTVDLEVTTSLAVLQDLLEKKLTPQQAFMKGKLKIKGNMGLAMKLTVVLAATRKYLPGTSKL